MNWFILSVLATILFGIQSFLYKSVNERKTDKYLVTLVFMTTVEILAFFTLIFEGLSIVNISTTLLLGFLFAASFFLKTIGQMKALEYLPTGKVFPITSSNIILTVLYALFFFNETLKFSQILGIAIILISINLIHNNSKKSADYKKEKIGFIFAFLTIIPAAIMVITNKYASISVDPSFFIFVAYTFSVVISYLSHIISKNKNNKLFNREESIKIGILIGAINFAAYFLLLTALKTGPLSLIATIHTTYIVITIFLAKKIHKEQLSTKQLSFIILIILGIILLKV